MKNIKVLGTITLYVEYDIDDRNKIVEIQAVMPGQIPTISWDEKFEEELLSEIEELDDDGSHIFMLRPVLIKLSFIFFTVNNSLSLLGRYLMT